MSAIKMDAVVGIGGKIELTVPLPAGKTIEVLIRDPEALEDSSDEIEWDDQLQERLDALDSDGVDPRPWREVMGELRDRLLARRGPA